MDGDSLHARIIKWANELPHDESNNQQTFNDPEDKVKPSVLESLIAKVKHAIYHLYLLVKNSIASFIHLKKEFNAYS